ncbi:hypothetical protein [Naasia sp. SYSU D00948]|uniref:hypothetical protein n=1 Tax=Naasia sp. SYSU D00948 TaxID=2817379 RepID=UPI001B3167C9|nr:hypothetical protein [Naasia sp. SYSU D00948]
MSEAPHADPDALEQRPEQRGRRPLGPTALLAIGVGAGLLGLVPWLLTGMRLPLQNLWAESTAADAMPIALLPLSQYAVTLIAGLVVTGSAVAGLVARSARARGSVLWPALGVLLVHAVAGVQSAVVVGDGVEQSARGRLYLAAVVGVVVLSIAIGLAVLLLEARAPVPGAAVGFAVGALAAGIWLNGLVAPFGSLPPAGAYELLALTNWVPPILVGLAVAWCGVRSLSRIAGAVGALLVLWVGAAAIPAVSAAAGTRVLAAHPLEMLDYGLGVFLLRLGMPELVLPPLAVAVVVALAGSVVLRRRRRG